MKRTFPSLRTLCIHNPLLIVAVVVMSCVVLLYRPLEATGVSWSDAPQTFYGVVQTMPKVSGKTMLVDVRGRSGSASNHLLRVRLMHSDSVDQPDLLPGDIMLLHGVIETPRGSGNPSSPDFGVIQRQQGISGTVFCYVGHWKNTGRMELNLRLRALRLRASLVEQYRFYFHGRELAVLAALTLGDKSMLHAGQRELFAVTGTSHILALSGLHLGILLFLYNFFLRRLRSRRWAYLSLCVLGLAGIWSFVLLAGLPLSLVRAAVMYSVMQVAVLLRRDVFSFNNLSLAAIVILILWPRAIYDVGFQLSFLSVLGILLCHPLFPGLPRFGNTCVAQLAHKVCTFIYNIGTVSVCAVVATAPLVAYTFHALPLYGVLSSLVVVPLAYPLLFGALLFFMIPVLQAQLATVIGELLQWMFRSLDILASLPSASIAVYPTWQTTLLCYLLFFLLYSVVARSRFWKWLLLVLLSGGMIISIIHHAQTRTLKTQLVFYQNHRISALHAIENTDESYFWTTGPEQMDAAMRYIKRTYWEREGLSSPIVLRNDTATRTLAYTPHVLQFHQYRIGLLYDNLKKRATVTPLPVNYLYVARGWNKPLATALQYFTPDTLVLDAKLSDFYRRKYRTEADSLSLPYHDLYRDGALIIPITH